MKKLEVSVYGSCVSRDVVRVAESALELKSYYARSSWISSTTEPVVLPSQPSKLSSAFQQRMVEYDYQSRALRGAASSTGDVVLLDLVDERLGVYPVQPTGYVTWLNELNHSGWLPLTPHGPLIEFGSDEHFALFEQATQQVADKLESTNAVLLKFKFAAESIEGLQVPETRGKPGAWWDEQYERYYAAAEDAGIALLEVPTELCVTTEGHQWGIAQYHYVDDFYLWVVDHLRSVASG